MKTSGVTVRIPVYVRTVQKSMVEEGKEQVRHIWRRIEKILPIRLVVY
jgi:hypothetical protein